MMQPLTVTARLSSPPLVTSPILLDGLLYFGVGTEMGREAWQFVAAEDVFAAPLPLELVETEHGRWWAASCSRASGREQVAHAHRRLMSHEAEIWTDAKSLNQASGPDKALRIPLYYRPEMGTMTWTCVGDLDVVSRLLSWVGGVGSRVGQGWGTVDRWQVEPGGPSLEDYATDLWLRHLPVAAIPLPPTGLRCHRRPVRLVPPYYSADDAVQCWQIPEAP